ncbi:MAG TPA: peroxiredoxin family protein [Myxococcota bacterium]|nr:peroxiredoxin family protein [Myxococcota bacterium]
MPSARLKRAFLIPFFAFLGVVLLHSLWRSATSGLAPVWLGPLLVSGAFFSFLAWMMASGAARTSRDLPGLLSAGAAGVALALLGGAFGTTPARLPIAYAVAAFAGLLLYVFWYSRLDRRPSGALRVGAPLAEFVLEDERGESVSSLSLRGSAVVWLFYRGNWCPLCMAQIRGIADRYKEIEARGAKVALVSPQPHELTRALAQRFEVPFRFFVDRQGRAARDLGILHEGGVPIGIRGYDPDTVLPTAIVTDPDGLILLADQTDDYRVRPEPETFLAALDAIRG